ncbi:SixA phosphatase family protein [Azomonas macrocytogenes]|uniref:Phosphohistidine phosphatase n=1 Tax=Azomonas macrocytogenes TaxID=69962 RepID=A0A839T6B1_AZOMA|nr:histidine phosphatase family protein [Azomonas macrocytogenes]MBB3104599.1 phosphohistidine phosphatase [Azomonas macrocytogenes]
MKLWLLRHGEAEPKVRTDDERALTERGRREVSSSAVHLRGRSLACILVSPYVRAQQSAELVREYLGYTGPCETVPWIIPDSTPNEALPHLDRYDGRELLLVTHQTFVGEFASLLVHGHRSEPLSMPTGSLAELEGEVIAAGAMHLVALYRPYSN